MGGAGANDYFKLLMNGVELTPYYGSSFDRQDSGNIGFAFIGGDPTLDNTDYVFALTQFRDAARTQAVQGVSIDVHVTSTPEPASVILVATGLLGRGVVSRRRKHA